MVSRRVWLLAFLLLLAFAPAAEAVTYLFEVPSMTIDLRPQTDGGLHVRYDIVFKNLSSDPIDIVDIGTPDKNFALGTFTATLNGKPLGEVRPSSYVTGVEVPLTGHEIRTGKTGRLVVEFTHPKMVYADSDDDAYTSVEFGNTYFGAEYAKSTMDLTVNWHFPDGVTGNETKWHGDEPTSKKVSGDHIVFTYEKPAASPSQMYKFGIGFPARVMQPGAIVKVTLLDSCLGLLAALVGALAGLMAMIFPIALFAVPIILRLVLHRRRMKHYLPPALGIEGAGPKRGLTAPEAAVVLEMPPDRVLMMILFSLMKKGAVTVQSTKPLKLAKADVIPDELRPYEKDFIGTIRKDGTPAEGKLRDLFVDFIKAVNAKLKGFSRKETKAFYQSVVAAAWKQVEGAATPEVGNLFADRAEWLAMDEDFGRKSDRMFREREVIFLPDWWHHGWGYSRPVATAGGAAPGPFSLPGADFAHQFTSSLSAFSSNIVESISSFTNSITSKTNPPPVTTSSGGHSGGGCACACACAGCACACAGGGR